MNIKPLKIVLEVKKTYHGDMLDIHIEAPNRDHMAFQKPVNFESFIKPDECLSYFDRAFDAMKASFMAIIRNDVKEYKEQQMFLNDPIGVIMAKTMSPREYVNMYKEDKE